MSGLTGLQTEAAPRHARRRRRGRGLVVLVFLMLLAGLVLGAVAGGRSLVDALRREPVADYPGPGGAEVLVEVTQGQGAAAIGKTLEAQDVVKSVAAFTAAAAADERSRRVQPGFYRLRTRMSGAAAVALLLDPAARQRNKAGLPEGTELSVALQRVADSTGIPLADLQAAAQAPGALGLPAWSGGQLEGFLFPATYDVGPGTSATEALAAMVARFDKAAAELDLAARAAAIGRTPYEVLITASLIEKETAFPADRPKVARVVYNRLAVGMPLQFDSTVNYALPEKKARLTLQDTQIESPYNTYRYKGLPPTPINSPGEAALTAALAPASGDWTYFITTAKDGSSLFTSDYNAFVNAKEKAQAEGIY